MKKLLYWWLKILVRWLAPRKPIVTAQLEHLLIIKLCCIGDVLFTTPLTRAIKKHYPWVRLSYLVTSWCQPLVAANSDVDEVMAFNIYQQPSLLAKVKSIYHIVQALRKRKIDAVLVLHRTPLSGLLTALSRIPIRIGFDWQGQGFALTHPVPFRAEAHEVDRHLDCLRPLGLASADNQPELVPKQHVMDEAKQLLQQVNCDVKQRPLIALFPGGGVNPGTTMMTKRWTLTGYRQLCHLLIRHYHAQLLLVGNDDDATIGDELIRQDTLLQHNLRRCEGQTGLLSLAGVLQQCDCFIGGDSGPLHMADAVGCATVGIFGPTDPALLAPRSRHHRTVKQAVPCSPCFTPWQLDTTTCRIGTCQCMTAVTAEQVFEAVQELLDEKGFGVQ